MTAPPRALPAISTRELSVRYGSVEALAPVSVDIPSGKLVAIVGPNGAGKTTFLKAALDLIRHGGTASVFGKPFAVVRSRVAYVPQRSAVDWQFPIRVREVAAMGLEARAKLLSRAERSQAVASALDRVGMGELADRGIGQLSGGQQQRVFLARALAQDAEMMCLDEPFQGVDAASEASMWSLLKGLRDEGRTVVAVHHDLATVPQSFDRVVILKGGLVAEGPVEEVFTSENLRAAYGEGYAALGRLVGVGT